MGLSSREPLPSHGIPRVLGFLRGVTGKAGEGTKALLPFPYTSAPFPVTVCLWVSVSHEEKDRWGNLSPF